MDRRSFLASLGGFAAYGALPNLAVASEKVKTKATIVIAGAGAAGLACASRLEQALDGAKIILLDERVAHYYQPGYTLVSAGLKSESYVISQTKDYIPKSVEWIEERVEQFDPASKSLTTNKNRKIAYDYLIVATGLKLDYAGIEGMDFAQIGKNGLGSIYGGSAQAAATWGALAQFKEKGGVGLFGRPDTEMKCAGAPLKYTFLADDHLRRAGNRGKAELIYNAHSDAVFTVPIVTEKVRMLFLDRGVKVNYKHVLSGIDLGKKRAFYKTPTGTVELPYDFINVVPPMRAPDAVRNSELAWQSGAFAADGWMEVNKGNLQHTRFPNIFAIGDVAGVPKGKTAASVKWQVPVVVNHLVAMLSGKTSTAVYNGYTSCPLITKIGRAMLVEFDYNNNLTPSFPGVIAPLEELWVTWVMKETALKPTYLAMLRGLA